MSFSFRPQQEPFPRWMGPFSPARGTNSGFRFNSRRFGCWLTDDVGREFWPLARSGGVTALESLVLGEWGGGRVLLLPNGYAIKPLQDEDVGKRALIGHWAGEVVLQTPGVLEFNLARPTGLAGGSNWPGPGHLGLECYLKATDGALSCQWYHPAAYGREMIKQQLRGPDRALATGFKACRPGDDGGRVRVTANGHIITKKKQRDGSWVTLYVGFVPPGSWGNWSHWIEGGSA